MERPRAGRDYPGTWQAFEEWFHSEDACRAFLVGLRWPDGFVCPVCGEGDAWETTSGRFMCALCGRQTSVTAGTIFHRTRKPLRTWFAVMWFVCAQKNGASARNVEQMFGFGSYETAWAWLHKIRRAMVRPDRDCLGGVGCAVELDETFVGARTPMDAGSKYANKARVVIAVELLQPKGLGRVRMRVIDPAQAKADIEDFVADAIEPGTIVWTDGATHYNGIARAAHVQHEVLQMVQADEPAHKLLPAVNRVASLLKRWIAGTLHGGQSLPQLDYYLDEYTFRFNRRASRSTGMLFYRLCQQAVNTDPKPLHTLTQSGSFS